MDVALFDYELPQERIAQKPLEQRAESRMLTLSRSGPVDLADRQFADLPEYIQPGDLLVLNDTRVIPARLIGTRPTGGKAEVLLLHQEQPDVWEALVRPGAKMRIGSRAVFGDGELQAEVLSMGEAGLRTVRLHYDGQLEPILDRVGQTPLPPYIKREQPTGEDKTRYQTIYADAPGAAAAPTAGLHFDEPTLQAVRDAGARIAHVTLHVGLGTFRPVAADTVEDHDMHAEWCRVSAETAQAIAQTRESGGRVIAVGTTVVRALESRADDEGIVTPGSGLTSIFIYPGYAFRVIDALLTNFHLPRSTLIMMVSAFAGRERILQAYRHAVDSGYRFYSYGDCMLIH